MSQKIEEERQFIIVTDDDGNEVKMEVLLTLDIEEEGKSYLFAVFADQNDTSEEEEDLFAYRYEVDGDQILIYSIDDDDEWEKVKTHFDHFLESQDQDHD